MRNITIEASEEELKVLEKALQEEAAKLQGFYMRAKWSYENGTCPKEYVDKVERDLVLLRSIQDKIVQEIDFGNEVY